MLDAHIDSGARATVAGIRQPIALANQFGVIDVEPDDQTRIREFLEKPQRPDGLADSPGEVLASMGNYIFDADALIEAVEADGELPTSNHDMGGDIVPYFVGRGEAGVYDMKRNDVPGLDGARPRLLARRRDDRLVLRRAPGPHLDAADLQPVQHGVADPLADGQLAAGEVRARLGRAASATRSTRSSRSAPCCRARTSSAASSDRGPSPAAARRSPTRCSSTTCGSARARASTARSSTRTSCSTTARPSASTASATSRAASR